MARRGVKTEATEAAIIEAAVALFGEKGYASTSLADIARAAGVSTSTLYCYFPHKEKLLDAPLAKMGSDLEERIRQIPSLEDQLRFYFVTSTLEAIDEYPILIYSIKMHQDYLENVGNKENPKDNARRDQRAAMLRTLLEQARDRGEASADLDCEMVSRIFVNEMIAAFESIALNSIKGNVEAYLNRWFDALLFLIH